VLLQRPEDDVILQRLRSSLPSRVCDIGLGLGLNLARWPSLLNIIFLILYFLDSQISFVNDPMRYTFLIVLNLTTGIILKLDVMSFSLIFYISEM